MGLLSKEVEIGLNGKSIKYYENLGYEIPRHKNKRGEMVVDKSAKIKVKTEDLTYGSAAIVLVKCDNCGKEYEKKYSKYSKANHDGKIYCVHCANTILLSGENNPAWNPNLTYEEREIKRHNPENLQFTKKCLAIAKYKSQLSGKDGELCVHHLDDFANHIDKRYEVSNGFVLTDEEHKSFHSWQHIHYKDKPCTKEQFEEWCGITIIPNKYNGEYLPTARQIYCIEENKIYENVEQLAKEWNVHTVSAYYVCNHKKIKKNTYYKSLKGKHLLWLDEYEMCSKEDIEIYLEWCKTNPTKHSKSVICLTTGLIFESQIKASKHYNISKPCDIGMCCKDIRKTRGKLSDGTPLKWMYLSEWEQLDESQQEELKNKYYINN